MVDVDVRLLCCSSHCLSPKYSRAAPQVTDAMLLLDSPYPATGSVVVVNQTSQLVDATLRPVPLSEVYGAPLALKSTRRRVADRGVESLGGA